MTKFKKAFKRSGMKQLELADEIGVTPQAITGWLRDGLPARRIFEVSKVLDVPVAELFEGDLSKDVSSLLDGIDSDDLTSARSIVNFLYEKLFALSISELNRLTGQIENIAEVKKRTSED